jgi:cytochrome c peroxidase
MKVHAFKLVVLALFFMGMHGHFQSSDSLSSLFARLTTTLGLAEGSKAKAAKTSIGDVRTLLAAYDQWKTDYVQNGGDQKLTLKLVYTKALSAEFTTAHGVMTLDLTDGSLFVEVSGLSEKESFDVWLINNWASAGQDQNRGRTDARVHVGRLKHIAGTATLRAHLDSQTLAGFEISLAAVGRAGKPFAEAGLLFGSPSLFQRIYYSELRGQFASLADSNQLRNSQSILSSFLSAPFRVLIPAPAYAKDKSGKLDLPSTMEALVARGEDLFFKETFNGNGRTCGTCHPAENNLTIDPKFIATLPSNDPLFVAEFNPNLRCSPKCRFENPFLMRKFGLILENVDGLDDLDRFAMRGVPHTLGLSTSLTPAPFPDGTTTPPNHRTGWGGDGAPGDGTLREFATGAVRQHFTLTLNRVPGKDFRLPTPGELDAMEAFQLSLGRQTDLNLRSVTMKGPFAERGRQLFLNEAKCDNCHSNAGANTVVVNGESVPSNANFDTGVEQFPHAADIPADGGFGTQVGECPTGGCGNGTFNTPSLVEAASTGPFFHNNAVKTIEEAVDFYNSTAFAESPGGQAIVTLTGGGIELTDTEVKEVAAFLRVINALEKIRSATELLDRAFDARALREARRPLNISNAEIGHGIRVLQEVKLHGVAVAHLKAARTLLTAAGRIQFAPARNALLKLAMRQLEKARGDMV